jgi:hypothetical protein
MACHMALHASVQPVSMRSAGRCVRAAPLGRGAFFGGSAQLAAARPQRCRRAALRAQAFQSEWPDPDFIKETKEAFPEKGVASVEEARVGRAGNSAACKWYQCIPLLNVGLLSHAYALSS